VVTSSLRENTAAPHIAVSGWNHGYTSEDNRKTTSTNGRVPINTPNELNQYNKRTIPPRIRFQWQRKHRSSRYCWYPLRHPTISI
jgi:hypothetical protein